MHNGGKKTHLHVRHYPQRNQQRLVISGLIMRNLTPGHKTLRPTPAESPFGTSFSSRPHNHPPPLHAPCALAMTSVERLLTSPMRPLPKSVSSHSTLINRLVSLESSDNKSALLRAKRCFWKRKRPPSGPKCTFETVTRQSSNLPLMSGMRRKASTMEGDKVLLDTSRTRQNPNQLTAL